MNELEVKPPELAEKDPFEIHLLEPDRISFSRSSGGVFQAVIEGKAYDEIVLFRVFPFRYTTQFISVRNAKNEEIGIVRDIALLDRESRMEIEKELQLRYFLPIVTRIESVKQKADLWIWELGTNLGDTRIVMRNLHEFMQFPGNNRVILTDMNGKRCEIRDYEQLDSHSKRQLRDVM